MGYKKTMVDEMVNELNCWGRDDLLLKTKVVYRKELNALSTLQLMQRYGSLTFHCFEDGKPKP